MHCGAGCATSDFLRFFFFVFVRVVLFLLLSYFLTKIEREGAVVYQPFGTDAPACEDSRCSGVDLAF